MSKLELEMLIEDNLELYIMKCKDCRTNHNECHINWNIICNSDCQALNLMKTIVKGVKGV